ncbi:hypothetical protein M9434_002292 [Picochlorum sp. BPE23]|nr:hypothetical protein M9434_002292 [Picochlorum sp. BPE23]
MQCSLLSGRVVSALPSKARWIKSTQRHAATTRCLAVAKPSDELSKEMSNIDVSDASDSNGVVMPAAVASTLLYPLVMSDPALAIGREYGIVEGQIFSLMHPAFMFFLLGASLYAGYLGFQWRRVRELGTEIKGLKAQRDASAPKSEEGAERPASPLDATIASLESERKDLIGQKLNDKHHNWGSLILGLGVLMAIAGPCNTFLRTGKLFPGPHLYAGAGMVVLWAMAAALVPSMQKGNDAARSLHIGFNAINIGLFLWQVPTGLEIVAKVFQFTTLP